jgi:hypothetical protein
MLRIAIRAYDSGPKVCVLTESVMVFITSTEDDDMSVRSGLRLMNGRHNMVAEAEEPRSLKF